jgi:hypothetical protein
LKLLLSFGAADDSELLWRLARAYYLVGENSTDVEVTKEHTTKASDLIGKALAKDDKSANIHKWVAITLGKLGDFTDTTTKIQNSFKIKVRRKEEGTLVFKAPFFYYWQGTRVESCRAGSHRRDSSAHSGKMVLWSGQHFFHRKRNRVRHFCCSSRV